MKTYLLIIVVISLFATSCKKDTSEPKAPVKDLTIGADLAAYHIFKKGSYWVYKDSISQQTDTITVIKSHLGIKDEKEFDSDTLIRYQVGGVVYSHSSSLKNSVYSIHGPTYHNYTSEVNTAGIFMAFPMLTTKVIGYDGKLHLPPTEQAVSVGTFSFPLGIETDWIAFGTSDYNQHTNRFTYHKFVLARDVGIIKRSIKNDTLHVVWELVDYKIAQ